MAEQDNQEWQSYNAARARAMGEDPAKYGFTDKQLPWAGPPERFQTPGEYQNMYTKPWYSPQMQKRQQMKQMMMQQLMMQRANGRVPMMPPQRPQMGGPQMPQMGEQMGSPNMQMPRPPPLPDGYFSGEQMGPPPPQARYNMFPERPPQQRPSQGRGY